MESIASKLKTRRESLNVSLEKISNDTHISMHHLKNLENGQYADLPGGMYNRAILRVYCDEIGLDKNEILQCYDEEITPQPEKPEINSPAAPIPKIKTHTAVVWSVVFLFGVGLFLNWEWFISALSPYFSSGYVSLSGDLPSNQPPVPVKTMTAGVAVSADSLSGGDNAAEAPSKQIVREAFTADAVLQPLRLEIVGREECWLSVNRDDLGTVVKILSPGDVAFFTATRTISVVVGNAGGVSLRINDRVAKTLWDSGQVVRLTIDENTVQNLIDLSAS